MFTELVAQHGATGSQRRVVQPLLPLRSIHDQLAQTVQRQASAHRTEIDLERRQIEVPDLPQLLLIHLVRDRHFDQHRLRPVRRELIVLLVLFFVIAPLNPGGDAAEDARQRLRQTPDNIRHDAAEAPLQFHGLEPQFGGRAPPQDLDAMVIPAVAIPIRCVTLHGDMQARCSDAPRVFEDRLDGSVQQGLATHRRGRVRVHARRQLRLEQRLVLVGPGVERLARLVRGPDPRLRRQLAITPVGAPTRRRQ